MTLETSCRSIINLITDIKQLLWRYLWDLSFISDSRLKNIINPSCSHFFTFIEGIFCRVCFQPIFLLGGLGHGSDLHANSTVWAELLHPSLFCLRREEQEAALSGLRRRYWSSVNGVFGGQTDSSRDVSASTAPSSGLIEPLQVPVSSLEQNPTENQSSSRGSRLVYQSTDRVWVFIHFLI